MKILISPAKKMRSDPDTLAPEALPASFPRRSASCPPCAP